MAPLKMSSGSSIPDMAQRIAILGWGSLIWDDRFPEFDKHREDWRLDGPTIRLEFSRISGTRGGALTLVIDAKHGTACRVAYALSKRKTVDDAIADLRCREQTVLSRIGFVLPDGSHRPNGRDEAAIDTIREWARENDVDAAVWTDLDSNFEQVCGEPFSLEAALLHVQGLDPPGKAQAAEYVWRSPDFVVTPLRAALQAAPWFPSAPSTPE